MSKKLVLIMLITCGVLIIIMAKIVERQSAVIHALEQRNFVMREYAVQLAQSLEKEGGFNSGSISGLIPK